MHDKRIICAISGGVDSAVAAALLRKQGFDVLGSFLKLYDSPRFKESEKRAKKIAKILDISFITLDLRKEFKKRIIDYFLEEYKRGQTPNPCVACNKEIKFGLLLEKALNLGVDFIATGHYARISPAPFGKMGKIKLLRAKDKKKDQSYFLWMLNQEQLKHVLFPVGNYTKEEVRNLAKKFKLPVFAAPESQEICFVQTTINDFLTRRIKQKSGQIVDTTGKIIGRHQGLAFYTIGQRKGIGLAGGPYWVLDKESKKNLLVVTKNEKDLEKKELIAENINWISGKEPKLPLKVKAKIRYRHKTEPAFIVEPGKVVFNRPQRAITPGQSVVFYLSDELLGGGIITGSLTNFVSVIQYRQRRGLNKKKRRR